MVERRDYLYEGVLYQGTITRKKIKSLILRADVREKTVRISAPFRTSYKAIDRFVIANLPKLLKRMEAYQAPAEEASSYVLGQKTDLVFATPREWHLYLKKIGMPYLNDRVRYYEDLMGIKPPYRITIRDMKSRYGSNSKKTHTLSFASLLFHYAPETIDSVIVHELAHEFQRNHSARFYEVVYRYCPNYKALHTKLRKHQYE